MSWWTWMLNSSPRSRKPLALFFDINLMMLHCLYIIRLFKRYVKHTINGRVLMIMSDISFVGRMRGLLHFLLEITEGTVLVVLTVFKSICNAQSTYFGSYCPRTNSSIYYFYLRCRLCAVANFRAGAEGPNSRIVACMHRALQLNYSNINTVSVLPSRSIVLSIATFFITVCIITFLLIQCEFWMVKIWFIFSFGAYWTPCCCGLLSTLRICTEHSSCINWSFMRGRCVVYKTHVAILPHDATDFCWDRRDLINGPNFLYVERWICVRRSSDSLN